MALGLALLAARADAGAASLVRRVGELTDFRFTNHFSGGLESVAGVFLEEQMPAAQTMPSSTPGWALAWDAGTHRLVPLPQTPGAIFTERASTLGAGVVLAHGIYQDVDYEQLDGRALERATAVVRYPFGIGDDVVRPFEDIRSLTLHQRFYVLGVAYGVTDRVDVALDVPVVHTQLVGRSVIPLSPDAGSEAVRADATDTGFGDTLLRTKWQAGTLAGAVWALELGLRLPSGSARNFRGAGSVGVLPTAVVSRGIGPVGLHLELGVDADTAHPSASRLRYRVGGTLRLLDWLGATAEVVGSSGVATRRVPVKGQDVSVWIPRADVVDTVIAVHAAALGRVDAFAGIDVPVTSDGPRPDVVPLFGISAGF